MRPRAHCVPARGDHLADSPRVAARAIALDDAHTRNDQHRAPSRKPRRTRHRIECWGRSVDQQHRSRRRVPQLAVRSTHAKLLISAGRSGYRPGPAECGLKVNREGAFKVRATADRVDEILDQIDGYRFSEELED